MSDAVLRFEIRVPDAVLDDLRERLTHTRWPGSIFEFAKIIGPLSDPAAHGGDPRDAFHVVCPSLPGYGFSGPTRSSGCDVQRVVRRWTPMPAGGHFAALEEPEALVGEIRAFFRDLRRSAPS